MVALAENKILKSGGRCNADAETQNYYVRNRYYLPTLGRWLTRDPIGYQGGINLYEYVQSSPVGNVDGAGEANKKYLIPLVKRYFPYVWFNHISTWERVVVRYNCEKGPNLIETNLKGRTGSSDSVYPFVRTVRLTTTVRLADIKKT